MPENKSLKYLNDYKEIHNKSNHTCLACDFLNKPINSHTVSRALFNFFGNTSSKNNNEVYEIKKFNIVKLLKDNKAFGDETIHQKTASTRPLFCSKHDKELFESLEHNYRDYNFLNPEFKNKNIFLLGYRALCLAYYECKISNKRLDILKTEAKEQVSKEDFIIIEKEQERLTNQLNQLKKELSEYTCMLDNENYNDSKFFSIKYSLKANSTHNLAFVSTINDKTKGGGGVVTITHMPIDEVNGYFLLQWHKSDVNNEVAKIVIRGLLEIPCEKIEMAIHELAFKVSNVFCRIEWEDKHKIFQDGKRCKDIARFLESKKDIFNNWENIQIELIM